MTQSWKEIHITCDGDTALSLSDQLQLLGAKAVTFHDAGHNPIFEPDPEKMALWKNTIVVGLFDKTQISEALIHYLKQFGEITLHDLQDQDWVRLSLSQFKPIQFGEKFWVCPTWITPPDPEAINIILDPGMAFGTGKHATTSLCLEWLNKNPPQDKIVIDYGCGSGILGIASYKLGAQQVYGVDTDEQALITTQENARMNLVPESAILTYLPKAMPLIKTDLLIANILLQPLIALYPHFLKFMKEDSKIVLSGILESQINDIVKVYEEHFQLKTPVLKDGWVCLEGVVRR